MFFIQIKDKHQVMGRLAIYELCANLQQNMHTPHLIRMDFMVYMTENSKFYFLQLFWIFFYISDQPRIKGSTIFDDYVLHVKL